MLGHGTCIVNFAGFRIVAEIVIVCIVGIESRFDCRVAGIRDRTHGKSLTLLAVSIVTVAVGNILLSVLGGGGESGFDRIE